jgi:aspartate/methionine/tyrosine aminotransferase
LDSDAEGGFHLDLERLMATVDARTRAVYLASPGNPTGWIMEAEQQRALLDFCRERGLWLIADEVYARIVYDRPFAPSFLELAEPDDPLLVVNSFSKAWAMTGWRLGWLTHPPAFAPIIDRLIEFNICGAPVFHQRAGLAALGEGEAFVAEMVARCRHGGERLSALPGIHLARPRGAFYAFFEVDGLSDSLAYAKEILERGAVGLAPGSAFGPGGEGHLRLCFANSAERLSEALDRLEGVLARGRATP